VASKLKLKTEYTPLTVICEWGMTYNGRTGKFNTMSYKADFNPEDEKTKYKINKFKNKKAKIRFLCQMVIGFLWENLAFSIFEVKCFLSSP
jgi:hypothetical protein